MYKILIIIGFLSFNGCFRSANVMYVGDYAELVNPKGEVCQEGNMIIFPERIQYYYKNCDVVKRVFPKESLLPKP